MTLASSIFPRRALAFALAAGAVVVQAQPVSVSPISPTAPPPRATQPAVTAPVTPPPVVSATPLAPSAPLAETAPAPASPLPSPSAPAAAPAAASTTDAALPPLEGSGAVRWRCGGIGSDESTAMRAAMASHPVSLLFARADDGAYLADVQIDLRPEGGAGASAQWRASGPVCLVQLPPGRYTVEASFEGRSQRQSVQAGGTPRTLDFRF